MSDTTSDSDDDGTFKFLYSKDLDPIPNSQTVTITATSNTIYGLVNTAKTAVADFETTFKTPCTSDTYTIIEATTQTNPSADRYTGGDVVFTYNPLTITPDFCATTVTCKNVSGPSTVLDTCQELTPDGTLTQNFTELQYANDGLAPGDYVFTYTVTTDIVDSSPSLDFTFTVTLIDPCSPPNSVTAASLSNQFYTIT